MNMPFFIFVFVSFSEKKREDSRSKGVITSDIMNIYNDNVADSNTFTSKEDNFLYIILLGLVFLVIIIIISINIANNFKKDNTFIFVILGNNDSKIYESNNQASIKKYCNYCFSSYALLIKRLAINHLKINKQHICILGKEKEQNFNISSIIPNNKIIIQLTFDEIYETESSQTELNITPYKNIEDIIVSMRSLIDLANCKNPNIILFLYDNGDERSVCKLNFLELYLKILNIHHSSLYIYNESCKKNSIIKIIKNYFEISEIISSFTPKITQDELFFLALAAKEIYPKGNYVQLNAIQSLDRKYFNYINKRNIDNTFSYLCLFAKGEIQLEQLYQKFPSFFSKYDIDYLAKIVKCYVLKYRIPDDYEVIHLKFEKGIRAIQKALKKFTFTIEQFWVFINDLRDNKQNFADKQYKIHSNHYIITSSHENGPSPTYGTIMVNENTKIIPGSPVMASYIIETLMNRSLSRKSICKIKKAVYGDHEGLIIEYATQCLQSKKKKWVRLSINYWESKSIFNKKILIDQDKNYMSKHSIEEVMNSIGYKLLLRCKIQFDRQNNCVTKKMQPLFKKNKINTIGIRLVDINKNVDYSLGEIEYIEYSGFNDQNEYNYNYLHNLDYSKKSDPTPNHLFEDLFDDTNYDSALTQSHLNRIIREVKIEKLMIYPVRFLVIFYYELNKIAENEAFIKKHPHINQAIPTKIPPNFRLNLSNWIDYFFPTYVLEEEIDNFILHFYQFIVKYEIQEKDVKNIFYNFMNVADQVASQLSTVDKKAAYYPERLKIIHK